MIFDLWLKRIFEGNFFWGAPTPLQLKENKIILEGEEGNSPL
jgi:hypothetical protein